MSKQRANATTNEERPQPQNEEQTSGCAEVSGEAAVEAAAAAAAAETVHGAVVEEYKARISTLASELSDLKDQYLRKAAEFENFRKRMTREKQESIEFANQSLLLDLIPVIDDFERAIKSSEASMDYASFHEGISMIEKRLVSTLESKWGLKRFDSAGEAFDPNRHEAIMVENSADVEDATVGEDFLRGYTLKERVVRSAKVKVLMPASSNADQSAAENNSASGGQS